MNVRSKPELWGQRSALLGNVSLNTFPHQNNHVNFATCTHTEIEERLEAVFSFGSVWWLYIWVQSEPKWAADQVLIEFSNLKQTCVGQSGFYGLHFSVNLNVHQNGGGPSTWIAEIQTQTMASLKFQCHAITNKCPEAAL
jgi:hypothetical protein